MVDCPTWKRSGTSTQRADRAVPVRGALLSIVAGVGIAAFEIVETLVIGLDVWLHAIGLGPAPEPILVGAAPLPAPLRVAAPLWRQPFYLIFGVIVIALALRLREHSRGWSRYGASRRTRWCLRPRP
jgi:hypothetical protein